MKYALIGCGRIATNHVTAAVNNNLENSCGMRRSARKDGSNSRKAQFSR